MEPAAGIAFTALLTMQGFMLGINKWRGREKRLGKFQLLTNCKQLKV